MIEPRPRRAGLSAEQQREIIERYEQRGASLRSVAAETFVCPSTVANVLIACGIPRRRQGGSKPTLSTDALLHAGELYAMGWTIQEIARAQGVSRSTVIYRLGRLGAQRRSRSESAMLAWETRRANERERARSMVA